MRGDGCLEGWGTLGSSWLDFGPQVSGTQTLFFDEFAELLVAGHVR